MAFENYLHMVTMMYYKKNLNINEMLITTDNIKEFIALKPNQQTKESNKLKDLLK